MNLKEAAEQALKYLESVSDWDTTYPIGKAKEALRQALAEEEPWVKTYCGGKPNYTTPVDTANMSQECVDETAKREHEPVAWMTHINGLNPLFHKTRASALNWQTQPTPLYTAPPKREWVELTDEDMEALFLSEDGVCFARYIEAKLKEKNG